MNFLILAKLKKKAGFLKFSIKNPGGHSVCLIFGKKMNNSFCLLKYNDVKN